MSSNSQSHHVLEEIGFSLVVIFFACCLDLNVYFVLALKHDSTSLFGVNIILLVESRRNF